MNDPDAVYAPPQTEPQSQAQPPLGPPPLPPSSLKHRFFTAGTFLAILIIAFFIVMALLSPYSASSDRASAETEPTQENPESAPKVSALAEMQSKLIVGLLEVDKDLAIDQAKELIPLSNSPEMARATASVFVFLDRDEFAEQALKILGDSLADEPIDNLIRLAINDPDSLSPENRQLLESDLGWTGRVLIGSFDDAVRKLVLEEARKSLMILGVFVLGAAVIVIGGLVLLILAIVKKRKSFRFVPAAPEHGRFHFQGFACYLLGMFGIGLGLVAFLGADMPLGFSVALMFGAMLIGLSWPLIRGIRFSVVRRDIGLHTGQGLFRELGCGLLGYVTITPIIVVGLGLTVAMQALVTFLSDGTAEPASHPAMEWLADPTWQTIAMTFLIGSVAAPIVEEIMFRGALHRGLRFRFGFLGSTLVACFIFAAVHPQGIVAVPGLMAVAFGLTLLREWRDSLIAPMVAHGIHNGAILTMATLM
ncbi:MAG: membrane protease YdiL (CAAX protease family) [Verrucomicrobiales bacterium]|jgi:membrane protease YdiL (CAAX protease family)